MPQIPHIYNTLTTDFSTSSSTYQTALESDALSAQDYWIVVNAQVGGSSTSVLPKFRITHNGDQISGSVFIYRPITIFHESRYSFFAKISSSDGDTIKLEASVEVAGTTETANIKTASIVCMSLENLSLGTDYLYQESVVNDQNDGVYRDRASVNIPATKHTAGSWLILAQCHQLGDNTGDWSYQRIEYKGLGTATETKTKFLDLSEESVDYLQRVVSVPSVGMPDHLGGSISNGQYKTVSIQTKDSDDRVTNTFCTVARIFGIRLESTIYAKHYQNDSYTTLSSSGSFDTVATIEAFEPPQDYQLTIDAGLVPTADGTVFFGYSIFEPRGSTTTDLRCWADLNADGSSLISGLLDDTIQEAFSGDEQLGAGFLAVKPVMLVSEGNYKSELSLKTNSTVGKAVARSLCIINLGAPVTEESGPRAKLEMNRVIRLS